MLWIETKSKSLVIQVSTSTSTAYSPTYYWSKYILPNAVLVKHFNMIWNALRERLAHDSCSRCMNNLAESTSASKTNRTTSLTRFQCRVEPLRPQNCGWKFSKYETTFSSAQITPPYHGTLNKDRFRSTSSAGLHRGRGYTLHTRSQVEEGFCSRVPSTSSCYASISITTQ